MATRKDMVGIEVDRETHRLLQAQRARINEDLLPVGLNIKQWQVVKLLVLLGVESAYREVAANHLDLVGGR